MALRQDGKPAVDQLDVNPIDEQRCFAELNERAEDGLCEAPTAPGVRGEENHEEKAGTHEEKIGIGVPVVVDGVEADWRFVEELRKRTGGNAKDAEEGKGERFAVPGEFGLQKKANG